MCGSGTIVVEAALIAADRAPGLARTFGFQKLAWFDGPAVAAHEADRARPREDGAAAPTIFASDIAPGAVGKAQSNLRAAQVDGFVRARAGRLPDACPRRRRAASCSPIRPTACGSPTSTRWRTLYPLMGDALKQRFAGWTAYFFTGDLRLPKLIHLKVARKHAAHQRRARLPAVRVSDGEGQRAYRERRVVLMARSASTIVRASCWCGSVALLAAYACLFHRYAVDFPRVDDYSQILAVPYYFSQQSSLADRLQFVLSLSVEHRIATLRLAALAQALLLGGLDFVALMLAGAGALACAIALVVIEAPRESRAWVTLIAVALFVSPVSYEAQFWATGALQHLGVLALSIAALWCLGRTGGAARAAGIALAVAAALTSANGLMTLPAAAVMAWSAGRRRDAAIAAFATIAVFVPYFVGFDAGEATGSGLADPLAMARFLPAAIGSLMMHGAPAIALGLALLGAWVWLLRQRARLPPVVIGWACFLAASYAAMAVGRAGLGEEAALLSRYRPYSAAFALVTLVAMLHALPQSQHRVAGAIATPLVLAWFAVTWVLILPVVASASLGQEITRATYLQTGHGIYVPWPPQEYGDFMLDRARALGYFKPMPARDPAFLSPGSGTGRWCGCAG